MICHPAATLNSLTSHGSPFLPGSGSANIFIGSKPALRAVIDLHICPLSDGLKPHVGGVFQLVAGLFFLIICPP